VQTVNERIDESAFEMCRKYPHYRPLGLKEWTRRSGINLETLIANPQHWVALTTAIDGPGVELRSPRNSAGAGA
jgi:hypothetical protein